MKKRRNILVRAMALLLALIMVLSSFQVPAYAAEGGTGIFGVSGENTEESEDQNAVNESADDSTRTLLQQTITATITAEPTVKGRLKALAKGAKGLLSANPDEPEITLTGLLPEDASVVAYPVSVSIPEHKVLVAYDITIYAPVLDEKGNETDDRDIWQPENSVSVSIGDPALAEINGRVKIYHMEDKNSEAEFVCDAAVDAGAVSFDADSFSIYAIGEESSDPKVHYRFWWSKEDMQNHTNAAYKDIALKNNEALQAPADPVDESRGKFLGWYTSDDQEFTCDGVTAVIPEGTTTDTYVDIYAKFDGTQYATFQSLYIDMKRVVFHTEELTDAGDGTYTLNLNNVPSYGAPVGYKFLGWSLTQPTDPLGYGENIPEEGEGRYYKPKETITGLTGSVTLYPVAKKMHEVSFNGNGGTIENLPVYKIQVTNDDTWEEVLGELRVERKGYSRNGVWWSGPDSSASAINLSGAINLYEDVEYYAHWTATTTSVTVKYWKEPVEKNTATEKHPYELIDAEIIEVPTGTTLTLSTSSMPIGSKTLAADTIRVNIASGGAKVNGGTFTADPDLKYFYTDNISAVDASGAYHSTNHPEYEGGLNVSVADDGSTIVDVWYNRKTYQINYTFKLRSFGGDAYVDSGGISRINTKLPSSGYYNIRLGESLSGRWPNVDAYEFSPIGSLGFSVVSLGKRQSGNSYPDAVSAIFDTPLSFVNAQLLNCADSSGKIELWGRYNNNNFKGGLVTATVTENYQNADGSYTSSPQNYKYGKGTSQNDAEPYTTPFYPGYVLNVQKTLANNANAYSVTENPNGTVSITYKRDGPYTANVYYDLASYIVYLNYGETALTAEGTTINYKHNIDTKLSSSDIAGVYSNPKSTGLIPEYMEFGGWYTDESCNEGYKLTTSNTMPANNVILYAKMTPRTVSAKVDNGIETGTERITDPQLNLSGSEMGSSIRYLDYQHEYGTETPYVAHTHTIAEFLPTYWVTPVWENHVFTGWQIREKDASGNWSEWHDLVDVNVAVDHDIELKATWQDMTRHSIHYIENGKEVYLDPETYVEGKTVVIKGTDTEIYHKDTGVTEVFQYWQTSDGTTQYKPGDKITMGDSDITLTAVFAPGGVTTGSEKATYTFMTPDGNGGWVKYYEEIVYKAERLSPPPETPTSGSEVFEGWYLDENLTKRFNGFSDAVSTPVDTTLYASFKRPYRVTYRGYDATGDGELITVQTYPYDGSENLNTMGVGADYTYKSGSTTYALIGWDTTKRAPGSIPSSYYSGYTDHKVTNDMTLYPVLEDGFWLTYYHDENMVTIPSVYYASSQNLNFTWPDPDEVTRTGFDFTGKWYTNPDRTQEFNWNTKLTQDTIIYAGWTPKTDLKSKYSVVWWVEKADSNGDVNDLSNYFYSNAETFSDVPVGTQIGPNTVISGSAASNVAHVPENIIAANNRNYFAFNKAIVSYAKGINDDSAVTLSAGQTAPVDYSDMTTLNIYIQRVRYKLTFYLNGNGTITYNGETYNNSWVVPGGVWLDMPYGDKWPVQSDENISGARLIMANGKKYNNWQTNISGASNYKTRAVIVERDYLTDVTNRAFTFTLTTTSSSGNPSWALYRFRDTTSDEYTDTDYKGISYDQFFPDGAQISAKTFVGYSIDNASTNAADNRTSDYEFKYYRPFYYSNNTSGTQNFVTLRTPGSGNNVDIINPNGTVYTGNNRIYYYSSETAATPSSYATAANIRSGSSTYFNIIDKYTYYYTRMKKDIHLHDADGNEIPEENGGIIRDVLVGSKLYLNANEIGTPGDHGIATPPGKQFGGDKSGWSRAENALVDKFDATDTVTEMPLYDIHYYLQWETKQVKVTLQKSKVDEESGAVVLSGESQVYGPMDYGTKLSAFGLQSEELANYKFRGWLDANTLEPIDLTKPITEDTVVKGDYYDLRSKSLYYDLNGGTLKSGQADPIEGTTLVNGRYKDNDKYMVGASVPVKNIAATKVTSPAGTVDFSYWNTKPDGSGDSYYPNDAIEIPSGQEVVLYAIYAPIMETTLVYDLNYVDTSNPKPADVEVLFRDYRDTTVPSGILKVNDHYTVGTEYEGGEYNRITFGSQELTAEQVRSEWRFLGWAKTREATEPDFEDGSTIRVTSYDEVTGEYLEKQYLFAVWERMPAYLKIENASNTKNLTFRLTVGDGSYAETLWQGADAGTIVKASGQIYYEIAVNMGTNKVLYLPKAAGFDYTLQVVYNGSVVETLSDQRLRWQEGKDGSTGTLIEGTYAEVQANVSTNFNALTYSPTKQYIHAVIEDSDVNLTVSKTVAGEMGDTTKDFSFELNGLGSVTSVTGKKYTSASDTTGTDYTGTVSGNKITFTLKHGERIELKVPSGTTLTLSETGLSGLGYETWMKTGETPYGTATKPSEQNKTSLELTTLSSDTTVQVLNWHDIVSPTGVTLRFLPWILIALAGAAMFLLFRRRREDLEQ